jgi:hypothetical protein
MVVEEVVLGRARISFRLAAAGLAAALAALAAAGCAGSAVSTVEQLHQAVRAAKPGDEIVIAPGTYRLLYTLRLSEPGVTLRGATGRRDDVVLVGGGMNVDRSPAEAVIIEADDVTIRDLTLRDFWKHGLHIRAEADTDGTWIYNVKTVNIGERHVKGSMGWRGGYWTDDVVIERLHMLQTEPRGIRPGHPVSPEDYIGGIDVMRARNWVIRDCLAEGIRGATGGGNAAIFIWNGVENVLIERNRILGCCKGIALGNPSGPGAGQHHATGGIIRNNFILRSSGTDLNNIGLELCNAKDVKVYHNTIYSQDASYVRSVHLFDEAGEGLTTNVELAYNIIRGQIRDNTVAGLGAAAATSGWRSVGNLHGWMQDGRWHGTPIEADWFVDPAKGDLHLTARAVPAIDQARPLAEVPEDIDGSRRPRGPYPDVGADEYRP